MSRELIREAIVAELQRQNIEIAGENDVQFVNGQINLTSLVEAIWRPMDPNRTTNAAGTFGNVQI